MVNLREKPYYLNDEQIQWVEDTIAGMTIEEKIGQLFVNMVGNAAPTAAPAPQDSGYGEQGGSPYTPPAPAAEPAGEHLLPTAQLWQLSIQKKP